MSRWFRHYAGMMRDDKLVRVSIRSKQPIERVLWVWGAILESATEIDDGGRYDFDAEEAAYFLRADQDDILAVARELENAGRLSEGFVVKWGDRQFQSDRSAERQRRYRERQKTSDCDGKSQQRPCDSDERVTSPSRHRDAPETETETYTETEIKEPNGSSSSDDALTPSDVLEGWNTLAAECGLPTAKSMKGARLRACKARLREYPEPEAWLTAFRHIRQTPFLRGDDGKDWRATIDFVLQASSFVKLTEESYGKAN